MESPVLHPVPQPRAENPPRGISPRIRSEDLFLAGREIVIEHAGRDYRLRLTSRGKLILTA